MKKHLTLIYAALFLCQAERMDAQLSGGYGHSLFLCNTGEVTAWGRNSSGQLGDGTGWGDASFPVQINRLSGITLVAAGGEHSLFVKNDGTAWACGNNIYGRLGDGTITKRLFPVQVSGLTGIIAASAGLYHSLFLKNDGTVWACGWNNFGQLGDGTRAERHFPVQVSGLTGIIAIASGGNHSLFLKNDSTVWACGWNSNGQLGDGQGGSSSIYTSIPIQASSLSGITAIAAGGSISLFLKNDSTVWACGYHSGQFANGPPIQVNGLTGIIAVAAGLSHSLFLKNDGTVWAYGNNDFGQLGDGTTTNKTLPVQVSSLSGITALAGCYSHSLFLKHDGTVWTCGSNYYGQLGDGTDTTRYFPVQIQDICISTISGRVKTEAGIPISGVTVMLSGDKTQTDTTDIIGSYNFTVVQRGTYTITPLKINDVTVNNGITLTDALLMRRHILGMGALPSPYKTIAGAEVNAEGDTTITTQDILFTRSLILGNITSFPTNRLWQFVSSDYVFPDTQHPFPFDKTRTYTNITSNQTNQNFIGIKLGDVNGSWDGNIP